MTSTETTLNAQRRLTPAELDDVFDDPQHGEPGMDRMAVHIVWEALLLLGVVGVGFVFHRGHPAGISGAGLHTLLLNAAALGMITVGVALSLRAAAVNLAVGPIAIAAGLFFATHADRGLLAAAGITVVLAAGVGAVIGVLVVVLHVPGWAASLAGALALVVWIDKHTAPAALNVSYHPAKHAIYWYAGFAAVSVVGGLLGLSRPIRRAVGRFRPVADPGARRGAAAAVLTLLAVIASSAFAAAGGVLAALTSSGAVASDGLLLSGLAVAGALVGGTSAFGRRGGIFGTLLAVTLIQLLLNLGLVANWNMSPFALAAGALGLGLVVTRLVEAFGRPAAARAQVAEPDDWGVAQRDAVTSTNSWSTGSPSGTSDWSSQLPSRSADDTWGGARDDRWGS